MAEVTCVYSYELYPNLSLELSTTMYVNACIVVVTTSVY